MFCTNSDTDEWSMEYNQHHGSSLTGTIHELASIDDRDDVDIHFPASFDSYNFEYPLIEGYRLANSQSLILSSTVPNSDAELLERHKRDIPWAFAASQDLVMDGSGTVTEEESTQETVTNTPQSTITVQLNLTETTPTSTVITTADTGVVSSTESPTTATGSSSLSSTTTSTSSTTITLQTSEAILNTTTTTVSTSSTTTTTTTTTMTTTTTTGPTTCGWSNWMPLTNCTPECGIAYRTEKRSCIDYTTGVSCDSFSCGGGDETQNVTCSFSPPCETLTVTPQTSIRDSTVRIIPYTLPDRMNFFQQTYRRIWISNKGYITFDTPFYGRTMTTSGFERIQKQAIVAPFWTDLVYDNTSSSMTINWYNSIDSNTRAINNYSDIVQSTINSACPISFCSNQFLAVRVVRITWNNLIYELSHTNQSINISFSAYLINTYDQSQYSYPQLRSYFTFDYSNLPTNLYYLRPFIGYRGKTNETLKVFNDPIYYQNAAFLVDSPRRKSFYIGSRFLTQCEVIYLQETQKNMLNPGQNLNDIIKNPRFPCPCTLRQVQVDGRFNRLFSETYYEIAQNLVCYGPMINNWIHIGRTSQLLKSQTCCYHRYNQGLITSGYLAGSVLSDSSILFQRHSSQRRIQFYDQCCSPSNINGIPNWDTCRLYYQLHPPSSCTGYRSPTQVSGVGDPHVTTIDNGQYTCHIQGVYIFARTNQIAERQANMNLDNNLADSNLIYPDDLFRIHVRSILVAPALSYIERNYGYGSVFSSYTISALNYNFTIINNNGKFGCTINNLILTNTLANNLDYDYTNKNDTTDTDQYIYRIQQSARLEMNKTIPQLTLALWSGVTIRCEIIGENLECTLSLPEKFRTFIEGLAGNFNKNPSDDLFNRDTNTIVPITSSSNRTTLDNDIDVLNACRSWRAYTTDTTPDINRPIMPTKLYNWYRSNESSVFSSLYPQMNETLDETCSNNFECIHDYLIRVNSFTSKATASGLKLIQESRIIFTEMPPIDNLTLPIQIILPINQTDRNYQLGINITPNGATNVTNATVIIYPQNRTQNIATYGSTITIPIPNDAINFVDVLLSIKYGTNSISEKYLDIIACLCTNGGTCNFQQTNQISSHYEISSCDCPPQYDGDLCELEYNGCESGSACADEWDVGTICVPLSAPEQVIQERSYYCNGTCKVGYNSTDGYTCDNIDECEIDPLICGNGICIDMIGSYLCNCSLGYRFDNQTCIDINECIEPNIDGSFPRRCNDTDICINTNGRYECECSSIFNTTGNCIYNESLCDNYACKDNDTLLCLHGTINVNDSCIPWCHSTCPEFCELINGSNYQCNCQKYPGFEYSDDGKQCLQCRGPNYGINCSQSCQCIYGECNKNATNENDSCTCDPGYQLPYCNRIINACESTSSCNIITEDCRTDENTQRAACSCKSGYKIDNTTNSCTDINECDIESNCDDKTSYCTNTIGSYICTCKNGYTLASNSCIDINECEISTSCTNYMNTDCINMPGSYECRCKFGYSINGDKETLMQNVLNTTGSCLITDYTVDCQNTCIDLASCNSTTGRCTCPISTLELVDLSDSKETCQCPGYPFVNYTTGVCDSPLASTWFLLYLNPKATTRSVRITSPVISNIIFEISNILSKLNKTCDESCIQINETSTSPAILKYFIGLNISLNSSERFQLANDFYHDNISLSNDYNITVHIVINNKTKELERFTSRRRRCEECEILSHGSCISETEDSCRCYTNHEGYFCREASTTPDLSRVMSEEKKWIIIVGVLSAVAGLLLIMACFVCIVRIISTTRSRSSRKTRPSIGHGSYYIPRAHVPTMGTGGQDIFSWDGFSLSTNDERYNDTSNSYQSSSTTTYNPTYRIGEMSDEADFTLFDNLENLTSLAKSSIPRGQMIGMTGTLNSFPREQIIENLTGTFIDSNELDETILVTDMLEDMTKDDYRTDDFLEACNPYLIIPRATIRPEVITF
ncbi:unnamed protein product [Adineta steineri]|uniref:EGF-like domain-containing protein n=1 Tax=Adineta steineri TaxID=433720 RepID=A0A819GZY2_9BILA|nr:unnamed protein product [Adineta steineri]